MRKLLGTYLILLTAICADPLHPTEPLPLDYFLAPTAYRLPKLSLDGRKYGIVVAKDNVEVLTVVDLATGKAVPVTKSTEMKFVNYWWKSDSLILLLLEDVQDGSRQFQTFNLQSQKADLSGAFRSDFTSLVSPLYDEPDNVLVSTGRGWGLDLRTYNIRTGESVSAHINSAFVAYWIPDAKGQPVAGLGKFHKRWFVTLPAAPGQPWRQVELDEHNPPDFTPLFVAGDQQRLIGLQAGGADTASVVAWNPADNSKETILQSAEVDPEYFFITNNDRARTNLIVYETDRPQLHYLDPADQDLAREIDAALPGTTNYVISFTTDKGKLLIERRSDRIAGDFFLFDRKAHRMAKLGSAIAHTEPARLASSRYFTCSTRDGLPLHGRIYLPPGSSGPAPAVLWVGDLRERTHFTYDAFYQLLASRGFAVIKIDQRGTRGYGEKFAKSGDQAVAAMADDLIDGLDWLAREGLIDPTRVAIHGNDRGGLLAVQALARYPGRLAAWVNFSTPMYLNKLEADEFIFGRYSEDEIKERFGGETKRREYLELLDPITALPRIKVPSFHYYPWDLGAKALVNGGERLARYFEKSGGPKAFIKGQPIHNEWEYLMHRDEKVRAELKTVYAGLVTFLEQTLAVPAQGPAGGKP